MNTKTRLMKYQITAIRWCKEHVVEDTNAKLFNAGAFDLNVTVGNRGT